MNISNAGEDQNPISPNDTVNVAAIGLGSMGRVNLQSATSAGAKIVALCDVDQTLIEKARKYYPDATTYTDYRRLLEKEKGIDGVIVSTPNHSHAVISIAAMALGKHVYCEKPLAHTVAEVRKMVTVAQESNVATQMGNQGHAYETNRLAGLDRDALGSTTIPGEERGEVAEIGANVTNVKPGDRVAAGAYFDTRPDGGDIMTKLEETR